MQQMDRTKACWNCEADVGCDVTYCPFCGTDLLGSTINSTVNSQKQDTKFSDQSLQESLASLYKPPYSIRNRQGFGVPDEREESSFNQIESATENPLFQSYEEAKSVEVTDPPEASEPKVENINSGNILPLLFLMIGSHLFVLGALLLFCSKDGLITLQWNSRFWFMYCLLGFPLLYIGARQLKKAVNH